MEVLLSGTGGTTSYELSPFCTSNSVSSESELVYVGL